MSKETLESILRPVFAMWISVDGTSFEQAISRLMNGKLLGARGKGGRYFIGIIGLKRIERAYNELGRPQITPYSASDIVNRSFNYSDTLTV